MRLRIDMKRLIAILAAGVLLVSTAQATAAAPITCPPGQVVVKDSPGVWHCENKPDQGNPNTEETKNPND